jgi:hypothetical protein
MRLTPMLPDVAGSLFLTFTLDPSLFSGMVPELFGAEQLNP